MRVIGRVNEQSLPQKRDFHNTVIGLSMPKFSSHCGHFPHVWSWTYWQWPVPASS